MTPSYRTTILGIVSIVTAVLGAVTVFCKTGSFQTVDLPSVIASIAAGIGLLHARDQAAHVADVAKQPDVIVVAPETPPKP